VPFLEGKSSVGRLGIDIHATAGKGDVGFCNTWTLEISCTQAVRIYAGMPIGQLIYFEVSGEVQTSYSQKKSAKYNHRSVKPVPSQMWKNRF
jgi:dCTP deaminase